MSDPLQELAGANIELGNRPSPLAVPLAASAAQIAAAELERTVAQRPIVVINRPVRRESTFGTAVLATLGVLLVLSAAGGLGWAWWENSRPANQIDLGAFNRVQSGQSYQDVVGAVGFYGVPVHESQFGGGKYSLKTDAFDWGNPDGSGMRVVFQNGRVVAKEQKGLK